MRRFLTGRTSTPTRANGDGATSRNGRQRLRFARVVILAALAAGLMFALFPSAGFGSTQPTIMSDRADYTPGSTVTLTGANWVAGNSVHIVVNDTLGQTWQHVADVTAAGDGSIVDVFTLPNYFIAKFDVTATGSAGTVTTTFTDSSAVLSQCQ